jgi:DNA-binding winged helix-turn-helix (wHTH) protein
MLYAFGPYQLDTVGRRLTREGARDPMPVPDRQIEVLIQLVAHAGQVLSKDALVEAAWQDVAVTDNSLEQAISGLRRALGIPAGGGRYIETLARRGYRFAAPVSTIAGRHSDEALASMLAPYRAFLEGRAALHALDRASVERATALFDELARTSPDDPAAHLGLANALALTLESKRATGARDEALVARALHHAAEACRLSPASDEAWAALGLVSHHARQREQAVAATRRAVALAPDNWRHQIRLGYVSWGEERLRAARHALRLLPAFPLAHWLAATVHIARQALTPAERELVAGAAAQDSQPQGAPFPSSGLHLLLGLVRLAQGDAEEGLREFDRELACRHVSSIYSREACANSWCAIGAVRLRRADRDGALAAFDQAAAAVPGHSIPIAVRAALDGSRVLLDERLEQLRSREQTMEAALAEATCDTVAGNAAAAEAVVRAALERSPVDSSGWAIPVDPLLAVATHAPLWDPVLALLRSRAA